MFSRCTPVAAPGRAQAQRSHNSISSLARSALLATILLFFALPALAVQAVQPQQLQDNIHLTHPVVASQLHVLPALGNGASLTAMAASQPRVASFANSADGAWEVRWDMRADRPGVVQGSGIALIPGIGNDLRKSDLGLAAGEPVTMDTVVAELQGFIKTHHALLGTDGLSFRFDAKGSSVLGDQTHWTVRFAQYYKDVPVHDAYLYFQISNGNVVQFGTHRVAPVALRVQPALSRTDAFVAAFNQMPLTADAQLAKVLEPGELLILPTTAQPQALGTRYTGVPGQGYGHVLAWRFVMQLEKDTNSYELLFDAHTNKLLEVRSLTRYSQATVTGGVKPTGTTPEVVVPLPFVDVENSGSKTTNIDGHYEYTGGIASTSLGGKYFSINDNCGSIEQSDNTDGNLDFGISSGTDCVTPGQGGAGNTHASRTGFYHLSMINRIASTYLPSEPWLESTVSVNVNINDQCNAYWNGSLNFFKSGGSCANTGEIPGVFLHEWGHGIDSNVGGSAPEYGTGEAVGDTFAMIYMQSGCIGDGFYRNQSGECTGVRWPKAFSVADQQPSYEIAKPTTIESFAPSSCPYFTPQGVPYQGVMGYEGHRESLIISSANWDLIQNLIAEYGTQTGWEEMTSMWYGSLAAAQSAYQIVSGGRCNPQAVIDGCAASNMYTALIVADDDDGNLSNGTPNACRIWDAYNPHGIACGVRPTCTGGGEPDFVIRTTSTTQTICVPDQAVYTIDIDASQGFANPVTLALTNLPAGVVGTFSVNPVTPGNSTQLTLDAAAGTAAGSYSVTINGTALDSEGHSLILELVVNDGPPGSVSLQGPADGAVNTPTDPQLTWQAVADASSYTIEIATDPAFANIVVSESGLTSTSYTADSLALNTTHYWRVTAVNSCGIGQPSAAFSFTTELPQSYYILANLSGLQGDSVTLVLNDETSVTRASNGAFVFPTGVLQGQPYEITVTAQPENPAQTCVVVNGSGTMPDHNVSNVQINCTDYVPGFSVGGSVTGLEGSGLVLNLNGTHSLAVTGSSFTFTQELQDGGAYSVTVETQPASPAQLCTVSHGAGTISGADVTNIEVACGSDIIFADGFEL